MNKQVLGEVQKWPLSEAQRAQRRQAGCARAQKARRHQNGRFMSRTEQQAQEELDWVYARRGRPGGYVRGLIMRRDQPRLSRFYDDPRCSLRTCRRAFGDGPPYDEALPWGRQT